MERIGIIGAMEIEVMRLKDQMDNKKVVKKASLEFNQGNYQGKEIVVVRSGIGKVNAAMCAQILIDEFDVQLIINTGIAGGIADDVEIGDIVISSDAIQHDMDAVAFGYDVGVIPQMDNSVFEADAEIVDLAARVCKEKNSDINTHIGRVVSGDQFISGKEKKQWLLDTFKAYCAEMEGASIAQVAYLNDVKFVIIRAISDKADNTACDDYPQFEKEAANHAVTLVNGMLEEL